MTGHDQEKNVEEIVASAVRDMQRIHVLVNAQGFNVKAPATEFPLEDWDKLFAVNVRGVMLCCKHFASAHGASKAAARSSTCRPSEGSAALSAATWATAPPRAPWT